MKKLYYILTAIILVSLTSCRIDLRSDSKDLNIVERDVTVKPFEKIELYGGINVVYVQSDTVAARIKASENIIDRIEVKSDGTTLKIEIDDHLNQLHGIKSLINLAIDKSDGSFITPTVYVSSPDIIDVSVLGSGMFTSRKLIDTDNMMLNLKGSGDIDIDNLLCDNVKAYLLGSGDINIGKLNSVKTVIELKGSGDITVSEAKVKLTEADLLGSGDICINGEDCGEIKAVLTGSGDIDINGTFKNVIKKSQGSGDISVNNEIPEEPTEEESE